VGVCSVVSVVGGFRLGGAAKAGKLAKLLPGSLRKAADAFLPKPATLSRM
jgi:hypothetical protein